MTSIDLSTTYLGLELRNPLVVGAAAPLSETFAQLQALEAAGVKVGKTPSATAELAREILQAL